MNVPRRSDITNRVARRILRWCEMVGCPIGKCFTMSHTHTGALFAASKFKIRMRVGSASALNHPAYARARTAPNFGEVPLRQQVSSLPSDCLLRAITNPPRSILIQGRTFIEGYQ